MTGPSISVCIPQYERPQFVIAVIRSILRQDYTNYEIAISDDSSSEPSRIAIEQFLASLELAQRRRIVYVYQPRNLGYDGNVRASLALGNCDYLMLLGNDDALSSPDVLSRLATILNQLKPDVAFTNFMSGPSNQVARRAQHTRVVGRGPAVALQCYRSFSFVGGIVFRQTAFKSSDTSLYDGSIYVQIYLASAIIAGGGSVASIAEPFVAKDVQVEGVTADDYRATLRQINHRFHARAGGLDKVIAVAAAAILPHTPRHLRDRYARTIVRQVLTFTYPYWLYQYRCDGVHRASVNLALGCIPWRLTSGLELSPASHLALSSRYLAVTILGLLVPVVVLRRFIAMAYRLSKTLPR